MSSWGIGLAWAVDGPPGCRDRPDANSAQVRMTRQLVSRLPGLRPGH